MCIINSQAPLIGVRLQEPTIIQGYNLVTSLARGSNVPATREYVSGGSNEMEQLFDYKLSSGRMVIENAFGILKGRFRILKTIIGIDVRSVPTLIYACCILHNYLQLKGDRIEEENGQQPTPPSENNHEPEPEGGSSNKSQKDFAKKIRDALKEYLNEP